MRRQAARYSRLADILLRQNKLSREQLDNVLREMNLAGETLIFQLVKQNIFTSEEITEFISRSFGRPIVDLDQIEIPQNLTAISTDIMRRNKALPIKRAGNMLTLAVADPYDISALDEMAFISGCQIELVIVSEDQLLRHLDSLGTADGHLDDVMADLGASDMEVVDTSEAHLDEHTLTAET